MLKGPALISSDLYLSVIKCKCPTYDGNICPKFKKSSYVLCVGYLPDQKRLRRNEQNLNKNEQDPMLCQENKSHLHYLWCMPFIRPILEAYIYRFKEKRAGPFSIRLLYPSRFRCCFYVHFYSIPQWTPTFKRLESPTNKIICLICKLISSFNGLGLLNLNFRDIFS